MTAPDWLPNFFIAGAPKAGTSSMHSWLAAHPDAFGSSEKETYFFNDRGTHMFNPRFNVVNGLETYRAQFPVPPGVGPALILEATPSYIYSETALAHIPDLPSQPRCLFMLRNPAEQIYSLFTYFRGNWNWIPAEMTFADFLAAARSGTHGFKGNELAQHALTYARYVDFLERWRDRLGEERMMVVTFDDLKADPTRLTRRIADWAGLDPTFYDNYPFGRENETYVPRSRALQSVNVAVRGLLPRGRAYKMLRGAYRRLNTKKRNGPENSEQALLSDLRTEFAAHNDRLAKAFGLELSAWSAS